MEISPTRPTGLPVATRPETPVEDRAAREAARAFEATYLAEMLKHSGINSLPSGFGGGAGEEAFSSFLTQEYARLMAERGGIGIAEQVFHVLKQNGTGE
jgi:Rod binding domain-containing protein